MLYAFCFWHSCSLHVCWTLECSTPSKILFSNSPDCVIILFSECSISMVISQVTLVALTLSQVRSRYPHSTYGIPPCTGDLLHCARNNIPHCTEHPPLHCAHITQGGFDDPFIGLNVNNFLSRAPSQTVCTNYLKKKHQNVCFIAISSSCLLEIQPFCFHSAKNEHAVKESTIKLFRWNILRVL